MTIQEAKEKVDALFDELASAGISVNGWDDEGIYISHRGETPVKVEPRERVDIE